MSALYPAVHCAALPRPPQAFWPKSRQKPDDALCFTRTGRALCGRAGHLDLAPQRPRTTEEHAASRCQRHAARLPVDGSRADLRRKVTDLMAERQLRRMQALLDDVRDAAFLCRATE